MSDNLLSNPIKRPKEIVGKIFVVDRDSKYFYKGWVLIEENLHQFQRTLKEEIEYEWEFKKFENFLIYFIETSTNKLVEIKDAKSLNLIRRKEKIFIVLLEKTHKIVDIKEIESLYKWYVEGLKNYES